MTVLPDHPLVKICGLRSIEPAWVARDTGADLVGFVFTPSKRQVSPELVRSITNELDGSVKTIGLFVDESVEEINDIARSAGVDLLQIYWRDDERDLLELELPYLLVRRTRPGTSPEEVMNDFDRVMASANPPVRFLVDSYHPGEKGGSGTLADWELATELAARYPIVLAGGLNPENVGHAIQRVRPYGVDVSSGVEIDGVKSPERIRAFISNARIAFGH